MLFQLFIVLFGLSFSTLAFSQVTKFEFLSKDAQANLSGLLTYPSPSNKASVPLVIMVPGTGLFDADVHFGRSGTKKDLIFVSIENELLQSGFAVLRMNYRGVFCNFLNYPNKCASCAIEKQREDFKKSCLNNEIRSGVTPANIRDDIEQIYRWSLTQPKISSDQVLMFGHSEGSTHIARLVESKKIQPKGLIFMGGVTESLDSLIQWQIVDRVVENLVLMDVDKNSVITNDEVKSSHAANVLSIYPIDSLLSPTGSWTQNTIQEAMQTQFVHVQTDALSKNDRDPYPNTALTQASYAWWKMFFTPDTPMLFSLSKFEGQIIYHNGSIDTQTNAEREEKFLNSYLGPKPKNITFITHDLKGHTLGLDPLLGPVADDSMKILIESFKGVIGK